jgi:hypothetical protein
MADAGPVPCDIAESGMGHANMFVQLPPFWPLSMRPSQWSTNVDRRATYEMRP